MSQAVAVAPPLHEESPHDLVIRWGPIPGSPQAAFFDDDTPDATLLFSGGYGAGKTMTLTAKVLKLSAINAPLPIVWVVPRYSHIMGTILPTLEDLDPDTGDPWFLGADDFEYHETKHLLHWVGGGPIQFASAEKPDSIKGPNVAGAAMDEPGETRHSAWRNTTARVRHPRATLRQSLAAGTPEGLTWLADLFDESDLPAGYKVYRMATEENSELMRHHPGYLDQVRANATPAEQAAYLEGKFAALTGTLAYPMFDLEQHWREDVPITRALPLRITFDFNVDPMAAVVAQITQGPHGPELAVIDAVTIFGSTVMEVCAELVSRYRPWPAGVVVYGDATGKHRSTVSLKSNYDLIEELLAPIGTLALKVPRENPPVTRRVNSVNRLFADGRGVTRCVIRKTTPARTCTTRDLVRSLQQTVKKPGTDDIWKKAHDTITHHSDALGYLIAQEFPAEVPRVFDVGNFRKLQDW